MVEKFLKGFLIFLGVIAAGFILGDFVYTSRTFPETTFIGNINVSNMSVRNVIRKLKDADVDATCRTFITLHSSEEDYEYAPSEIGAYIKPRTTAYAAFKKSYNSNYIKSLLRRVVKRPRRLIIPLQLGLDLDITLPVLKEISNKVDISSIEAKCVFLGKGKYKVTDSRVGKVLRVKKTIDAMKKTFKNGKRTSILAIEKDPPKVSKNDLAPFPPIYSIGRFKTKYGYHDDLNRIHNIKLLYIPCL